MNSEKEYFLFWSGNVIFHVVNSFTTELCLRQRTCSLTDVDATSDVPARRTYTHAQWLQVVLLP